MLKNRLKSLVKYIKSTDSLIDIGCDHALLDIYLVKNNIIDKCIVSDISNNALEQGIENIKKYNLENNIQTRCGNGLEVLNESDNVNTIVISGMGTSTILSILDNSYLERVNKLIIQSNNDYYLLRKEIIRLGFIIVEEEVIVDNGKLYINIVFIRGNKDYSLEELMYGTIDMINKDTYYKYLINKNEIILNKVNDKELIKTLEKEIEFLKGKMLK